MFEINEKQIYLQAHPMDKLDAIRLVGKLLVDSNNIATDYIASMQQREKIANSYLGNGIAISHGMKEQRDLIKQTGVAVLQVPDGVIWNEGETAHLIVGIAAKSDEHIDLLRQLTRVLSDEEQVARLTSTSNPQDIIEALMGERSASSAYTCVSARGVDADQALQALCEALAQNFKPEDETVRPATTPHAETAWIPQAVSQTFVGVAAAPGLSIGPIKQFAHKTIGVADHSSEPTVEGELLQQVGHTDTQADAVATDTPAILIAEDLAPSDTAMLNPRAVLGLCTAGGGPISHTAIIARSLGIPAMVGAGKEILTIKDGTPCILDGSGGKMYLQPGNTDIQRALEIQRRLQKQQNVAAAQRFEPAITTDQQRIEVMANIGNLADAYAAAAAGAEGVGLLRTEFLYLARDAALTEDEQFAVYRDIVIALKQQPIIIRTLDIGGDIEVKYLNLPHEDNPFLGIRGVRLCLEHPELFIPQLRAIYRAAAHGPVSIMFPMIATLEDWEKAYTIAQQVRQELSAPEIPIGITVEVPAAAILSEQLAKEVDFLSIGTNDLTQYTLAMDRGHPQLAKQADSLHPAVLSLIKQTIDAATKAGKRIGVCGGLASDPLGACILIGLGVKELSVSIPAIAAIKAQIRSTSLTEMQATSLQALHCRSAAEVHDL